MTRFELTPSRWAAFACIGLLTVGLWGCDLLFPRHDMGVDNVGEEPLDDVLIEYDGGSAIDVGLVPALPGTEDLTVDIKGPLPETLSVRWKREDGTKHSQVVTVAEHSDRRSNRVAILEIDDENRITLKIYPIQKPGKYGLLEPIAVVEQGLDGG